MRLIQNGIKVLVIISFRIIINNTNINTYGRTLALIKYNKIKITKYKNNRYNSSQIMS